MDKNYSLRLLVCAICSLVVLSSCHTSPGSFYRVEQGDTLWRIAHAQDIEVAEIQKANPTLENNHLVVGRKLFLPNVSKVRTVPKPKLDTAQWEPSPTKASPAQKTLIKKSSPQPVGVIFSWPYRGKVLSPFGKRNLKMHNGIDIQIPFNQTINASSAGKVVYVGDQIEGYDRVIIILHDNHLFTIYAFVGDFLVRKNQIVTVRQPVAKPNTDSTPNFFHFEIRQVKTALDPEKYLR